MESVFWSEVTVRSSPNCCPVIAQQTRITCRPNIPHTYAHRKHMVSILNNSYIFSRKNQCSLFCSPILGDGSCAVGIVTAGRLFEKTILGLFVSQSSLWAPEWNNLSPIPLLFKPTKPGQRCSIVTPFKIKLRKANLGH